MRRGPAPMACRRRVGVAVGAAGHAPQAVEREQLVVVGQRVGRRARRARRRGRPGGRRRRGRGGWRRGRGRRRSGRRRGRCGAGRWTRARWYATTGPTTGRATMQVWATSATSTCTCRSARTAAATATSSPSPAARAPTRPTSRRCERELARAATCWRRGWRRSTSAAARRRWWARAAGAAARRAAAGARRAHRGGQPGDRRRRRWRPCSPSGAAACRSARRASTPGCCATLERQATPDAVRGAVAHAACGGRRGALARPHPRRAGRDDRASWTATSTGCWPSSRTTSPATSWRPSRARASRTATGRALAAQAEALEGQLDRVDRPAGGRRLPLVRDRELRPPGPRGPRTTPPTGWARDYLGHRRRRGLHRRRRAPGQRAAAGALPGGRGQRRRDVLAPAGAAGRPHPAGGAADARPAARRRRGPGTTVADVLDVREERRLAAARAAREPSR